MDRIEGGPSNMQPMVAFSGAPPIGLWNPEKATQDYSPGGTFLTVGGSNPDEGHTPLDHTPGPGDFSGPSGSFFDLPMPGANTYGNFPH